MPSFCGCNPFFLLIYSSQAMAIAENEDYMRRLNAYDGEAYRKGVGAIQNAARKIDDSPLPELGKNIARTIIIDAVNGAVQATRAAYAELTPEEFERIIQERVGGSADHLEADREGLKNLTRFFFPQGSPRNS